MGSEEYAERRKRQRGNKPIRRVGKDGVKMGVE